MGARVQTQREQSTAAALRQQVRSMVFALPVSPRVMANTGAGAGAGGLRAGAAAGGASIYTACLCITPDCNGWG